MIKNSLKLLFFGKLIIYIYNTPRKVIISYNKKNINEKN
jgi:hypothetical protein